MNKEKMNLIRELYRKHNDNIEAVYWELKQINSLEKAKKYDIDNLKKITFEECKTRDVFPAVYLIYDNNKLLYIGKSKNFYKRINQHFGLRGRFAALAGLKISYIDCSKESNSLDSIEQILIQAYNPPYNLHYRTQGKRVKY